MTHVVIVHRWGGSPESDWYPWLKTEIEKRGGTCKILKMPSPDTPIMSEWVSTLREELPDVNNDTYLVGHSIGCQTILRFLEDVPLHEEVGGVVLVAPWTKLKPQSYESEKDREIARPWVENPINWHKIVERDHNTTCFFSDDDPYVFLDETHFFQMKLNADIIVENKKGHFTQFDGVKKVPAIMHTLEKWGIFPDEKKPYPHHGISKG